MLYRPVYQLNLSGKIASRIPSCICNGLQAKPPEFERLAPQTESLKQNSFKQNSPNQNILKQNSPNQNILKQTNLGRTVSQSFSSGTAAHEPTSCLKSTRSSLTASVPQPAGRQGQKIHTSNERLGQHGTVVLKEDDKAEAHRSLREHASQRMHIRT